MVQPIIAITMGDPTGVGPEIIAKALAEPAVQTVCRPLVLGDRKAMERGIAIAGQYLRLENVTELPPETPKPGVVYLRELSNLTEADLAYGNPTAATGDAMYRYIVTAAKLCLSGTVAAMATAPISKEALNRGGHHYPGHTELLAELTGTAEFVMMLAGSRLRVALVTIHEALAEVPNLVTFEKVLATIKVTDRDMARYFKKRPRIAVTALNPHCGEAGLFGSEDEQIIRPAVAEACRQGVDAVGPLSADTLFYYAARGDYDAVVCMYHDQGLIPLKLLHFDDGVNVTLGLPIIRTSVDHGTAYDLAGTGLANAASMVAAISMAADMAKVRMRQEIGHE
ncbi:4-hydroxythreonine-4-phosphate dehydrogenase PdxA [Geobacter pelophilus]|uniref:4-hydroxythreonine-4-phosphate dehydrogenase n=1 Tax=Geoanaerobacter pelophilus TaxID=60036 RepID=A0AAW4L9Z9_9BACT|nr:4-hydroxythreonine-4-phosphate dehydrogenase PdxA [Geoanaerobacter pelophilus]MBT0664869.1 4-hydroxythreonine-4-phosphate dehydrogenase PdxA [Geoanaerobacter pelophilus]